MDVYRTELDRAGERYGAARETMLPRLAEIDAQQALVRAGGGEKYVARHRARGKLLARERIELLLDRDGPFLELSSLAAWGTPFAVGAAIVTGIGVVEGVECLVMANDPTVRGGALNQYTVRKVLRAFEIARANRLPVVQLTESGGADLPNQAEIFVPGGRTFFEITRLSAEGVPTVSVVFGNATAGGAYVPGMSDYTVFIRGRSKVFLGGPPLVKMAIGEETTDEELGGAEMHATVSGLGDYLAEDEPDALRITREIIAHLNWSKRGPGPSRSADEPLYDAEELLGIVPPDLKEPFEMREIIARVVDGSRLEEFKRLYGRTLVTCWASVHGYPVGILANNGILFSEESEKATQFIQLANRHDTPLLFLQNITGYMVGRAYERGGIIKDGAKMINAVTNSKVPHVTLMIGASYGAGNYGMSGRAYDPRFVFTWPSHRIAVMGPQQLAGVMSIVGRASAESSGRTWDAEQDALTRRMVEEQIERESSPLFATARIWDDGVIDPRDTRTVLGIALSACHSAEVRGAGAFGVFRM
ncbi:MAG: acetyl-CoA carboxylase carboxyltransferase subunit [Candidatus Rokubacteria bacterium RBG_16_73_20]|nr:MAG: acetyl-CoA carboxylase carboxyltransferase subunit [Candidatus Rokubacteria bacterium GWA2_73_35]OGK97980.1 MAG: acetyl-CoA carboxylase carboxyltransferase subunit [Candidatus Rokubacteria bacterium RBG_16_73_20]HBH02746.1 acetyl-CoA carboxylase carboxyltransferase subunit [Candidatus Rokubacteria bacterium]